MIIISQDKGKIINFDNMTRVYINFDEGDDDVCIRTETVDSLFEDLGYYKTEGRAKEVLGEIIKLYMKCNRDSYGSGFGYVANAVFEMPVE